MRINPILEWSYQDIWTYLQVLKIPYCVLYDQGFEIRDSDFRYTSLGSTTNTQPNPKLQRSDGTFSPAYCLEDGSFERLGR